MALKKKYSDVAHHTIYFGEAYEKHLNKIFEKKILSDDISYYLHRPSATDPNMAPEGQEAFYVLVPVPNNLSKTFADERTPGIPAPGCVPAPTKYKFLYISDLL